MTMDIKILESSFNAETSPIVKSKLDNLIKEVCNIQLKVSKITIVGFEISPLTFNIIIAN